MKVVRWLFSRIWYVVRLPLAPFVVVGAFAAGKFANKLVPPKPEVAPTPESGENQKP